MSVQQQVNSAVQAEVERAIKDRGEIGLQVVAYLKGELVVDAWGGVADADTRKPVDAETLFNIFSVTKAISATAIHIQAEKGLLDYDAPIGAYWPEWACNGKERATVRDALTHLTGTPQMPPGIDVETAADWDRVVEGIAKLTPMFSVGETPAYQAGTYGWVLGEIVRRTDPQHRDFRQFLQEELFRPLGVTDLWVGMTAEEERTLQPRIATLVDHASVPRTSDDTPMAKTTPRSMLLTPEVVTDSRFRRATNGATGGVSNARSLAPMWAMLANGGELNGVRLLSRERVDAACVPRGVNLPDPVMFGAVMPMSNGGYWMHSDAMSVVSPAIGPRTISTPGHGGSLGWADPDTGLAVAFCHNHMTNPPKGEDHPAYAIAKVIRESLGLG